MFDAASSSIQLTDSSGTSSISTSSLSSTNVKAEAVLYMNGDINQQLKIENIDIANTDLLDQFTGNHTVFFRNDKYEQELNGNATFNKTYDYNKIKAFYFTSAGFENGSLNGYETINDEIEKYKVQLNNLAKSLTISVNTIHSDDGKSLDFFNNYAEFSDEPAKVISVNKTIAEDPSRINASRVIGGNAGNGERAILIGQLRTIRMDILNVNDRTFFKNNVTLDLNNLTMKSSVSGTTIDSYFKSSISDLGVSSQEAKRMVTNQEALLNQLQTRKDSISGVSIDEEITNMIQFQRAYEANAKMISLIDSLLDTVVNGLLKR
jgi:flagellar hook-associated protein 1 FlgK